VRTTIFVLLIPAMKRLDNAVMWLRIVTITVFVLVTLVLRENVFMKK
jgi:hypothetical protein